jgi:hypothetical protein
MNQQQLVNPICGPCLSKYHILLRKYLSEKEVAELNAYGYRACIEQAQLCDLVFEAVGSEECLKCGNNTFELDGELYINFHVPFTSFYRLEVIKRSQVGKTFFNSTISCAKCGFVYQKCNMSEEHQEKSP